MGSCGFLYGVVFRRFSRLLQGLRGFSYDLQGFGVQDLGCRVWRAPGQLVLSSSVAPMSCHACENDGEYCHYNGYCNWFVSVQKLYW